MLMLMVKTQAPQGLELHGTMSNAAADSLAQNRGHRDSSGLTNTSDQRWVEEDAGAARQDAQVVGGSLDLTLEAQASQGPAILDTAFRHADLSAVQPAHRAPPTEAACPCRHSHRCMPWAATFNTLQHPLPQLL